MRTGFMGGTFDPPHNGHLISAECIRETAGLDRIVFIPAAVSPHKTGQKQTLPQHRLKMVELAVESHPYFEVLDYEIVKGRTSYTVETVQWLKMQTEFAGDDCFFIVGADSLRDLHTWKNPDEIVSEMMLLVARRPGVEDRETRHSYGDRVQMVQTPYIEISSTDIRRRIRLQLPVINFLPQAVLDYINLHGLYS